MQMKQSMLVTLAASLGLALTGCGDGKSKTPEKESAQAPTPEKQVESAQAPAEAAPEPAKNPQPGFDTSSLPGMAGREWTPTEGGTWYATVSPGAGEAVGPGTATVTVSMSMWTEDGSTVLLRDDDEGDLILPIGGDMFPGWNEGVAGMAVGEVRKIVIPYDQSLGGDGRGLLRCEDGSDDQQMLVIDVTLVAVDAVPEAPAMPLAAVGT